MNARKKFLLAALILVVAAAFSVVFMRRLVMSAPVESDISVVLDESKAKTVDTADLQGETNVACDAESVADEKNDEGESDGSSDEETQVTAFYDETERWMNTDKNSRPTLEDIEAFRRNFRKLPKWRKAECLQRALNLIPDENVMLLVGVLMDRKEDPAYVNMIYDDILNRDDVVKKPILDTIYKDKTHQRWDDTAWIMEVTGEYPEEK